MSFGFFGNSNFFSQFWRNAADFFLSIMGGSASNGTLGFIDVVTSAEGAGMNVLISVERVSGTAGAVGLSFGFVNETAVNGVDYVGTPGTLSWANGESGIKRISILLNRVTSSKTFRVQLFSATGGATIDTSKDDMVVTITPQANQAGVIGFRQLTQQQLAGQVMVIPVYRTDGGVGAVSAQYATANGTGSAGVDYVAASGTLNWANGDVAAKNISVTLLSPATDKTFLVNLSNPSGGAILNPQTQQMTGTIIGTGLVGNPGEFALEFLTYQTGESTTLAVKVKRLNGKAGAVSVDYDTANDTAVTPTNYTATSGTLNWADQDDADKTINIPILTVGGPLSFTIGINTPTGGASVQSANATATILILDSVTPTPVQQLYDQLIDSPMLASDGDAYGDGIIGYTNTNTLVKLWEALGGDAGGDDVLGWNGGNQGFNNAPENISADESLLPSEPMKIQLKRFVVPS